MRIEELEDPDAAKRVYYGKKVKTAACSVGQEDERQQEERYGWFQ